MQCGGMLEQTSLGLATVGPTGFAAQGGVASRAFRSRKRPALMRRACLSDMSGAELFEFRPAFLAGQRVRFMLHKVPCSS